MHCCTSCNIQNEGSNSFYDKLIKGNLTLRTIINIMQRNIPKIDEVLFVLAIYENKYRISIGIKRVKE